MRFVAINPDLANPTQPTRKFNKRIARDCEYNFALAHICIYPDGNLQFQWGGKHEH